MLNSLIDRFQAKFPPNRLTALAMGLLIPLAIAPAAAFLAIYVPAHFPGLPAFSAGQLTAFGIAGASAALLAGVTAGYKFIDGWQEDERNLAAKVELQIKHEHEAHIEAMRLESRERVAIAEQANSAAEAAEEIGIVGRELGTTPSGAVANASPPPAPPMPPLTLDPVLAAQEAAEAATPRHESPPIPMPPQAAAQEQARGDDAPPG